MTALMARVEYDLELAELLGSRAGPRLWSIRRHVRAVRRCRQLRRNTRVLMRWYRVVP